MPFNHYDPTPIAVNNWVRQEKYPFVATNAIILKPADINQILHPGFFKSCYSIIQDNKKFKSLRFVLKTDGTLRFAPDDQILSREGTVPGLSQMAIYGEVMAYACDGTPIPKSVRDSVCWSAGRVLFDSNDAVCGIETDTIEFAIPVDSLQLALKTMKAASIPMAPEITISDRDNLGKRSWFKTTSFGDTPPLTQSLFSSCTKEPAIAEKTQALNC